VDYTFAGQKFIDELNGSILLIPHPLIPPRSPLSSAGMT
jgi:hypothetical protein